jgi:type II secretion system protein N
MKCGWLCGCFGYLFNALALLALLLWLLFPEEACLRLLVRYINNACPLLSWQVQSMSLRIPEGLIMRGIEGYGARDAKTPLVRVESLTVRPDIAGMVQAMHLQAEYRMELVPGVITGKVRVDGGNKGLRVNGSAQGVQLSECRMLARHLERELQGTVSATFDGSVQPRSGAISELEAKLDIEQGRLGLKQPILAHTVLSFSHAEVIMRSRGEAIQLEQGLVDAELFSGQFVGEIMGLRDTGTDQLNISGTIQPRPAFFKGMGNGSLLKVIRTQLKERPVPFRISGNLQNPGIHFEEFSMLFQSLERELQ